ncbi:methyl-accepting chemotaxis protein [Psychrobacillus sp.]|uniref:methyl-accepting chemotaxis protein n=1 Tax=Psychrobacillus sp. TaxID=1871623 RepID=UPI0028BDE390|nr:methyl-accepting chemotaxis protein [Psychrobacillus sp.]
MRFRNFKINTKFNLLLIGVILFLTIIISLVAKSQINKVMNEVFTDRVEILSGIGYNWLDEVYEGEWTVKDGELYKGDMKISSNTDFIDEMGTITEGIVTIFQNDTRVMTNVMVDGERSIGTKASAEVSDLVLKKGETYIGEADVVGQKHLTIYKPIKDANGKNIGMWFVGVPIQIISDTVFALLFKIISVLVGAGAVAIIGSLLLTRTIIRPILTINNQLKEISEGEGDLTKELVVNTKDEIGELANSFNKMLGSLRTMMRQISITSDQVASSSEELTASAEQTTEATDQIAASIHEIADGSKAQVQGADESSKAMQEITMDIQRVAESTSSISKAAVETNEEAISGNESLQKVILQMNTIHLSVDQSASVVKQLGEQSEEIGNILGVITGIADQTNLLALNAAIEAARAGEHGKGFAVVADEVRKLAEQSKISADQIASLIKQIQGDTAHAVNVMEQGTVEVNAGMQVVKETETGFQKILTSIELVASQIQEVSAVAEEMSASAEQVNASTEEMATIAQISASNTQNVAAASEEQLASMEEISASASSMAKMAEDLQGLIHKFKF